MSLKSKLYLFGGVALLVACLVGKIAYDHRTIVAEQKTNTVLEIANDGLVHDAKLKHESGGVTDTVVAQATAKAQAVQPKQDRVEQATQTALRAVEQHYAALPQPVTQAAAAAQAKAEEDDVSRIQITSAWQTYCNAVPDNAKCADIPKVEPAEQGQT